MPDQTRNDWIPSRPDELGTLVVVSEPQDAPGLRPLTTQFATQTFNFDDEPLTKFYFSDVPYGLVAESSQRLAAYSYAWIPKGIRDLFTGKCSGQDCTESRECVRPGCVCKKSMFSSAWKCR